LANFLHFVQFHLVDGIPSTSKTKPKDRVTTANKWMGELFLKILVMSDSHGNINNMFDAVDLESPDWVLHLGDNDRDCNDFELLYPDIVLRSVRGNCDRSSGELETDEFVLDGKRFLMTHGHLYGVKTGKSKIISAAKSRGVDVLLFGHTHIPYYALVDGMTVINPGSIGAGGKCYAVLELNDGVLESVLKIL